jgi:hypothetical protein
MRQRKREREREREILFLQNHYISRDPDVKGYQVFNKY